MKNLRTSLTDEDYKWIDNNRDEIKPIENKWRMETKQPNEFIVDVFPEEQELVVKKLEEYWQESLILFQRLRETRRIVDRMQTDPFSKWFFTQGEKYKEGVRLKWLYQSMRRLQKLKTVYEKKRVEEQLSKEYFKTKEERKRFNIDRMFEKERLLVEIASCDNVVLKQEGENYRGLCPFHNEKNPSFLIYSNNWYHCYACQAHGNFIDYLMKRKNLTFREALEEADKFL